MKLTKTSDTHYGFSQRTHRIHETFLNNLYEEIVNNGSKALLHAGDWNCNKQDQLYRSLKMFRKYLPNIPIVTVRGNHCLWDWQKKGTRRLLWGEMQRIHAEWFKEHDIHHLENDGPVIIDNTIIVGWDGWYHDINVDSNDASQMIGNIDGQPTHYYQNRRAHKAFEKIVDMDLSMYDKVIGMTHMPPWTKGTNRLDMISNPAILPIAKEKFDIFVTGHSHDYRNRFSDGLYLINSGSDYDKPKWLTFDTEYKDPNGEENK